MFPGESLGMPTGMDMGLAGMLPSNIAAVPASQLGTLPIPQVQVPRMQEETAYQRMRQMSMMGRMGRMLGMGAPRQGYNSGRGMPGSMDTSTGVDPSTMDYDAANALLGQFGQHMPTNPSPYAMLPNSGFFGAHQRIGGALEGALFAAANTGPANTWGEGIQQVARGIIGGSAERARAVNQQYSQPFQQAMQMGQLQHLSQQMQLEQQHEALYKAQTEKDLRTPIPKQPYSGLHVGQDGKLYGIRNDDPNGTVQMLPGQDANANLLKPPPAPKNDFGGMSKGMSDLLSTYKNPDGTPLDPTKRPSPEVVSQAYKQIQQQMVTRATASAGVHAATSEQLQAAGFEHTDIDEAYKASIIKPNTKTSELVRDYGNVALQPGFIQQHNDQMDQAFGKGKYAKPASQRTPMPSSKAGTPKANAPIKINRDANGRITSIE